MTDLEKVMLGLDCCTSAKTPIPCGSCLYWGNDDYNDLYSCRIALMRDARELLMKTRWIPFHKRELTEKEKKLHPEWCFILDGEVPDDGQEILICRPWKNKSGYIIDLDQYINNGDTVYLDGAGDIENGMYWMPLPEPPKEE